MKGIAMIRTILAATLLCGTALAQAPDSAATTAFKQASEKMMAGMDAPYTGDADRDFVQGMLPHHEGAIDMARVELRYGHDPALKRLAHDIVISQAREQVFMRHWLLQHPAATP